MAVWLEAGEEGFAEGFAGKDAEVRGETEGDGES